VIKIDLPKPFRLFTIALGLSCAGRVVWRVAGGAELAIALFFDPQRRRFGQFEYYEFGAWG